MGRKGNEERRRRIFFNLLDAICLSPRKENEKRKKITKEGIYTGTTSRGLEILSFRGKKTSRELEGFSRVTKASYGSGLNRTECNGLLNQNRNRILEIGI